MFLVMWIEGTNNMVDKIKIIITKEKTRNLKNENLIITLNLTFLNFKLENLKFSLIFYIKTNKIIKFQK